MAHRKDKYVDHELVRYTPRQAIKDAVGFVARFFTLSNLKHGRLLRRKGHAGGNDRGGNGRRL